MKIVEICNLTGSRVYGNGTFRNVPLLPVDLQPFYSALSAFCAIIK